MPPPVAQIEQSSANPYRKIATIVLLLVVIGTAGVFAGLWFTLWPASDEAVVSTYTCGEGLSWGVTTGHSTRETYGGAISASTCEYHRAGLYRNDELVFSVANFTGCRDFKSDVDLFNGIDEPFYDGHQAFPAGAPIVSAMAVIDAVVPPPESADLGSIPYQLGFQISRASGLSIPEFLAASRCLLDNRDNFQQTFGQLHFNSGPLMWLALVDDSAPYARSDLPGTGQVFSCKNGYTYRTSGESLFVLAPGDAATKKDEYGFEMINDTQVAVIGINGRLYEPDRTNPGVVVALPYADYRGVDQQTLPAQFSDCTDSGGVSLQAFLESLNANNVLYEASQSL